MTINLTPLPGRPQLEAALAGLGRMIKRLSAPVPAPAKREKRWMNG